MIFIKSFNELIPNVAEFFYSVEPEIALCGYEGTAGFSVTKKVLFADEGLGTITYYYSSVHKEANVVYLLEPESSSRSFKLPTCLFGHDLLDHIKTANGFKGEHNIPIGINQFKYCYASNIICDKGVFTGVFKVKQHKTQHFTKYELLPYKVIDSKKYYYHILNNLNYMYEINIGIDFIQDLVGRLHKWVCPKVNPISGAGNAYAAYGHTSYVTENHRKQHNKGIWQGTYETIRKEFSHLDAEHHEALMNYLQQITPNEITTGMP